MHCFGTSSSRRLHGIGEFQVECANTAVKRVNTVDYLGVRLGEKMSGKDHAENVVKKCTGSCESCNCESCKRFT